jgi:hypothetical protein
MIRYLAVVAALVLAVGASAQNSTQHQHNAVANTNMIDGSVHPELVPDSTAYCLYLLAVSVPPNATLQDIQVQHAHLTKAGLNGLDEESLKIILAEFRAQYEAWTNRWNQVAQVQGDKFDATPFLKQQADMVQNTRTMLEMALSEDGLTQLHAHIQSEKRNMKVAAN